ncbi:hypothetical protein HUW51_19925 [Adhaeribacter swui]|uniref:Uncharacterized protein n=1 Tax=Adhaeribacter swui TaxID=2086471 RepID=A0A7G7GCJ6_9BACT|nr:hypothetical protein [Adhaeribacter swui]QNF34880.1 hypothetical protein HUW51_19925 [Adhaeribacter swui]
MMQTLGALYFAFGMLNWMTKSGLIGGIYNRPIAVANFTHFTVVAIAILKALIAHSAISISIWIIGALYLVFALAFTLILLRHPLKENSFV